MDLAQEGHGFEWPDRGFGNQDILDYLLSWAKMGSNNLHSYKCAPGEWVAGHPSLLPQKGRDARQLRTRQTKAKVFSLRRKGRQETRKEMCQTAELWTQGSLVPQR